ncbi:MULTISPECIES: hypothetical protein [Streptomyces]|uniref:hypothetical protein n=1 Tax=Streptomyces TaxID=1883 RepID=UPI0007C52269|nr:hypothetical protein [Streptomyces viridochromogenes]
MSARPRGRFLARFEVFAECLLTGVWIAVAALPLVTLPAALAAGATHLRRSTGDQQAGLRFFAADLRAALRDGGWSTGLGYAAALALVGADLALVRALPVPGGRPTAALAALAALWLTVTLLRAATAWRPGLRWRSLLGPAARRALRDPAGSLLVICGLAVTAASASLSAPLAPPALGILLASTLAAEHRLTAPPVAPAPPVAGNRSAGAQPASHAAAHRAPGLRPGPAPPPRCGHSFRWGGTGGHDGRRPLPGPGFRA